MTDTRSAPKSPAEQLATSIASTTSSKQEAKNKDTQTTGEIKKTGQQLAETKKQIEIKIPTGPKIVVRRNLTAGDVLPAGEYMKIVLAHITDKIVIRSVTSYQESNTLFSKQELVIVTYDVQGGVDENENIAEIIAEAVKLRGNLTLMEITTPPPIVYLPAIQPNKHPHFIYEIDNNFANYVARNSEYRQELQNKNVEKITVGYYKLDQDRLLYSGRITSQMIGDASVQFSPHHPYHCFPAAVEKDTNLQAKLVSENIHSVQMGLTKDNQVDIRVIAIDSYSISLQVSKTKDLQISEKAAESAVSTFRR